MNKAINSQAQIVRMPGWQKVVLVCMVVINIVIMPLLLLPTFLGGMAYALVLFLNAIAFTGYVYRALL